MRKGVQKATIAVAHHLIVIVFNVLARGEEYIEMGADYYHQSNKPNVVKRMAARLQRLG